MTSLSESKPLDQSLPPSIQKKYSHIEKKISPATPKP